MDAPRRYCSTCLRKELTHEDRSPKTCNKCIETKRKQRERRRLSSTSTVSSPASPRKYRTQTPALEVCHQPPTEYSTISTYSYPGKQETREPIAAPSNTTNFGLLPSDNIFANRQARHVYEKKDRAESLLKAFGDDGSGQEESDEDGQTSGGQVGAAQNVIGTSNLMAEDRRDREQGAGPAEQLTERGKGKGKERSK